MMDMYLIEATHKLIASYGLHLVEDITALDSYTAFRYVARLAHAIPMTDAWAYACTEAWLERYRQFQEAHAVGLSVHKWLEQVETALFQSRNLDGWLENLDAPTAADFCWWIRLDALKQNGYDFARFPCIDNYLQKRL